MSPASYHLTSFFLFCLQSRTSTSNFTDYRSITQHHSLMLFHAVFWCKYWAFIVQLLSSIYTGQKWLRRLWINISNWKMRSLCINSAVPKRVERSLKAVESLQGVQDRQGVGWESVCVTAAHRDDLRHDVWCVVSLVPSRESGIRLKLQLSACSNTEFLLHTCSTLWWGIETF